MINEVKNSVKAKMYDSTYTPFMSSYILSWLLINHIYVLYYFSDFKNKLDLINDYNFGQYNYNMWLTPLIIALVYVYIYPFFSKYFYAYTLKQQKERTDIKQKIEDKKLLTVEQSREIRLVHFKLEEEIDKKNQKIEFYKKEISTLESENLKIENSIQERITEKEKDIKEKALLEASNSIEIIEKDRNSIKLSLEKIEKQNKNLEEENKIKQTQINELKDKLIIKDKDDEDLRNKKYEQFSDEFTTEEIIVLETIYTNNITNTNSTSDYINKINSHTTIPKIKIEMILKSLVSKGFVILNNNNWKNNLTELGKKKVLEMFG